MAVIGRAFSLNAEIPLQLYSHRLHRGRDLAAPNVKRSRKKWAFHQVLHGFAPANSKLSSRVGRQRRPRQWGLPLVQRQLAPWPVDLSELSFGLGHFQRHFLVEQVQSRSSLLLRLHDRPTSGQCTVASDLPIRRAALHYQ